MNIKHTLIASAVLGAISAQAVALDFPPWPTFGQTSLTLEEVLHDSLNLQHGKVTKGLSRQHAEIGKGQLALKKEMNDQHDKIALPGGQHAKIVSGNESIKRKMKSQHDEIGKGQLALKKEMNDQYTDRTNEIKGIVSTFSNRHDVTQSELKSFRDAGETTLTDMIDTSADRYSALGVTLANIVGSLGKIEQYGASDNADLLAVGGEYKRRVDTEESSFALNTDGDDKNDITFEDRIDNLEGEVNTLTTDKAVAEKKLSDLKSTKNALGDDSTAFNDAIKSSIYNVPEVVEVIAVVAVPPAAIK